ncbi:CPBP family intramembrane glutamic endopeptidase [Streptococcus sanguinis]|jgi:abortive infection protein|uniref:CAAX amino terminal protease self-immunity n=1 Tax=Streptococcus sanguinis TaxID=1305 RepID=A0AB74DH33_STRSA|nr:CPBP family intramembrane glutamic endopeptidase [Streptococcus sanguinis]RSI27978.1 CAAX amino terminal protease self- immunity [Streptococcus sanguinis]RSI33815.1 CAAX amino terminal protease self- immunity [Streptococcus sanguinis]
MKQSITTIKRNVIIFAFFSTLCGWIGYVVDKVTGQAHYENIGTEIGSGSLGMLIWLVTPLICTIFLRSFGGDGWKEAGFSINFKDNKKLYLISFLVYPLVTIIVIFLGLMTQGIRVTDVKVEFTAYLGILLTQVGTQFIKNIFEESVWRAYLTNQLIKLKLSDLKLYLLVGFIWWIWHLPYIMKFLSEREIQNTLPVGRFAFFLIGMITVACWTVMYTEIFRLTKSVWPLVIMHTMEDAVINPLLLLGFVSVEKNQAFLFSLSVGMIPTILYLLVGLAIRKWRKNSSMESRANRVIKDDSVD